MCKLKVGAKILLKHTAFKGKHKIQDQWENTIYEFIEQPLGKIPVFKIQSMEGDDVTKVVHRNLLLPLFSDPSDQTSKSDNKSVVDQTVSTQAVIVLDAVTCHVHNLSTYGRVWVTNMFERELEFVTALFE